MREGVIGLGGGVIDGDSEEARAVTRLGVFHRGILPPSFSFFPPWPVLHFAFPLLSAAVLSLQAAQTSASWSQPP